MNTQQLHQLVTDGYIMVNKHPSADLYIYNYTAQTQYEGRWNDVTLACRGLILDGNNQVVARPFPKFFNLEELSNEVIPRESFEVFEKMDGSLGISYWIDIQAFIASRGSFTSEQALEATQMLHTQYAEVIPSLDKSKTYLFEIIYPENRIVVDYGNERKLVLLAIIDTQTGEETNVETLSVTSSDKPYFPIVKRYDGLNDLSKLKALEEDNKEGFVVRFKNGFRLKVKFEEYKRIHKIVTQVSNVSIWEHLKDGQTLTPILDRVPDEFYDWVKMTHAKLMADFQAVEQQAKQDFKVLPTRKETALYFLTCQYPAVLFKMLDGQPYDQVIWKILKPDYQKPFANKLEYM
ncbi:MAG: T4 RnlA family RNA ligase [Arcicella sp.]|nr:T4 RnlA family RNA ligase [Arcicella sp.]